MDVVVAVAVRHVAAVVGVVQIAVVLVLLRQVQAEQSAVLISVLVVTVAVVVAADDTSGFQVLHGFEPVIFHISRH